MKLKWIIKKKAILLGATVAIGFGATAYAAPTYKDVPATYFAYEAIGRIAEKGIMVGDSSGNYNPGKLVDKFEAVKALAQVAGFKYTGLTEAEKQFIDKAYKNYGSTLTLFKNRFKKWDSTSDKEIAYLLEKQVLAGEDLNKFVYAMQDGSEKVPSITREEMAVFIVRIMGKTAEANAGLASVAKFSDDASIADSCKASVYYLRKVGIVAQNSTYSPKTAVTKATMAVFFDNTLKVMNPTAAQNVTSSTTPPVTGTSTAANNASGQQSSSTKIESLSGTISNLFPSLNAVQIKTVTSEQKIGALSPTAVIYVDNALRQFTDLKIGMTAAAVVTDGKIIEIRAQSTTSTGNQTGTTTQTGTNSNTSSTTQTTTKPQLSNIEGIVSAVKSSTEGKTLDVEFKILRPNGEIMPEVRSYTLNDSCSITRGVATIQFSDIKVGDIVEAGINGSVVYEIKLQEKDIKFIGTLLEKRAATTTSLPVLRIANSAGTEYLFRVSSDTYIYRKLSGTVAWNELRVGDTVDIEAEYDKLISVYAQGARTSVDGWVEEISIKRENSGIVIKDKDSKLVSYGIINGMVDVYSLRVGSKIRVQLDSKEVESVIILEESVQDSLTGNIQSIHNGYVVVAATGGSAATSRLVYYDNNTVVTDATTGKVVTTGALYYDMQIFVTYSSTGSNKITAKTITIMKK